MKSTAKWSLQSRFKVKYNVADVSGSGPAVPRRSTCVVRDERLRGRDPVHAAAQPAGPLVGLEEGGPALRGAVREGATGGFRVL